MGPGDKHSQWEVEAFTHHTRGLPGMFFKKPLRCPGASHRFNIQRRGLVGSLSLSFPGCLHNWGGSPAS